MQLACQNGLLAATSTRGAGLIDPKSFSAFVAASTCHKFGWVSPTILVGVHKFPKKSKT